MSTNLSSVPKLQFFDNNGNPLVGGKLFTYAAGTTTPLATYTDSTGVTPNTNPIILDSRGEANVWLDATQYKFELKTSADALIWTVDNISNALNLSQLLASSGSAASPPYTFAADTTTGMFLAAAGQIGLSANGTPVFRSTDTQAVLDVNLQVSGTARRITGDFSNATVASRVMFQTSTTNGETSLGVIPNGTSPNSGVNIFNAANPTNAAFGGLLVGATEFQIRSAITGSGTYLPMTFYTGGSERVRVDTSGNVGIGTSSPSGASGTVLEVNGGAGQARFVLKNNTTGSASTDGSQIALVNSQLVIQNREASEIVFETNGAERVRIDASGNVGIGTNAPANRLQVSSPLTGTTARSNTVARIQTEATGRDVNIQLSDNVTNSVEIGMVGGNLYMATGGAVQAQLTSAGLFQYNSGYGSVATAFGCRAWINFDGTGTPAARASGNVSSITDNGAGDYTVNFTTAIVDANYAFTGAAESNNVGDARIVTARNGGISSSSCRITVRSDTNVAEDCPTVTFVVHR